MVIYTHFTPELCSLPRLKDAYNCCFVPKPVHSGALQRSAYKVVVYLQIQVQNTLLSIAIITIKLKCFFAHAFCSLTIMVCYPGTVKYSSLSCRHLSHTARSVDWRPSP